MSGSDQVGGAQGVVGSKVGKREVVAWAVVSGRTAVREDGCQHGGGPHAVGGDRTREPSTFSTYTRVPAVCCF